MLVEMIPVDDPTDFPVDEARCTNRDAKVDPIYRYSPGDRSQIVFIRACLVVDPVTPLMGLALAMPKDSTGGVKMVAASAFMNEPG